MAALSWTTSGKIVGSQVQPCPNQLGPDVVSNGPRVRPDKRDQALGSHHAQDRVESARNQIPLLEITEKDAQYRKAAGPRAGSEYLAAVLHMCGLVAAPVTSAPLADNGNGFCCQPASPLRWR